MYKRRRNRLNESIDDIFEADFIFEEEGDDDMPSLELDDADSDSDSDDSISKGDLADALGPLMDLAGLEGEDEDEDEEPEMDSMPSDDDSDEEEDDSDEEEPSDTDEGYEGDLPEGDVFLEIDENMLRNEIGKMRAMREGDAAAMDSHFGGGKKGKEPFVDGEDLNKHDHVSSIKESARKVVRENRKLRADLEEHKKALSAMKGQLQEMNLFNAKLLYANKLMQNKDLSLKQQKHIVESLDNAKTLGEAKVLFEGLTKSLNKSSSRTGALTEGTSRRVLGTSSRSTRSAQPAKNRVEVDRWALLAGIKG